MLRLLLTPSDDRVASVSALTSQLQAHLPPVDTVDALIRTQKGVQGTFSVSSGTTISGFEFTVACEKGSVTVGRDIVTVRESEQRDAKERTVDFAGQGSGVTEEVKAWAEGLAVAALDVDERQSPAEALRDLAIVSHQASSYE